MVIRPMTLFDNAQGGCNFSSDNEAWLRHVAVIIPCRNEFKTISSTIAALPASLGQWLVVDNGSTPECRQLLEQNLSPSNLLSHPCALGVGGAFLLGCQHLNSEILWICKLDGDGQFNDVSLIDFLRVAIHSNSTFIKTARCNSRGLWVEQARSASRHWGNQILTMMLSVASGYYLLEDATSGLFVINRHALEVAMSIGRIRNDYCFETSLLLSLATLGSDILELRVPVRYFEDRGVTFKGRHLVTPLLACLCIGAWRRIARFHLVYRLSLGGLLLTSSFIFFTTGAGLAMLATIKALSSSSPTTPGISTASTGLLGWGLITSLAYLAYDFASSFSHYSCRTLFECWHPRATHGIQATKEHQAKRPS